MEDKELNSVIDKCNLLYEIFNSSHELKSVLNSEDNELVLELASRFYNSNYKSYGIGFVLQQIGLTKEWIYDDYYEDMEEVDEILDKLPYASIGVMRLLLTVFLIELEDFLIKSYKDIRIISDSINEFNERIPESVTYKFGPGSYTVGSLIKSLINISGPITLLNMVMPDYKNNGNVSWPFNNKRVELLVKGKLVNYIFTKEIADKMSLFGEDTKYKGLTLSEAFGTLIIKRMIDDYCGED